MNNDRELVENAAKAAGVEVIWHPGWNLFIFKTTYQKWNPLTDDGDALRLAVKLGMCADSHIGDDARAYAANGVVCSEPRNPDPHAATRRAIVRAAAEIGRDMK